MSDDRNPTFWIVLSVVLLIAAVGLGVWAVVERGRADDAETALAAQQRAAAEAAQRTTAAEKARATLDDALARAKAELDRVGSAGSAAKACLQRAIETIDKAFSAGGIATAVQRLRTVVDECRAAAT